MEPLSLTRSIIKPLKKIDSLSLYDPLHCPEPILPYLAKMAGVRRVEGLSVAQKRRVIYQAISKAHLKGTDDFLRSIVEALGHDIKITYWHEDASIPVGMFDVDYSSSNDSNDRIFIYKARELIKDNKRLSLHLRDFNVNTKTKPQKMNYRFKQYIVTEFTTCNQN